MGESPKEEPPEETSEQPSEQQSAPSFFSWFTVTINPLYFLILIPALLLFTLLFCCIWCYKRVSDSCLHSPIPKVPTQPPREPGAYPFHDAACGQIPIRSEVI